MMYKVTETCVNCAACDSECPVEAISEKDGKRWVDPAKCVSCGACVGACPTDAIVEE
ncbi:MAG: 4Fe-4S binding protein [Treponema sp.]|nr:4Fe-4S binding protein [Treponema sp.]